ncbi:MAG: tetratricopeptide repeat protein [Chloroflexi bacterium]|jgi:tetratricopeptide (TPR) repeat protein|nr:tetratricopeptide repeat protein [Chloroflexota bacterium]MBT4342068.1 tetratricopeptide repeat protein [Chloroflexota bacterium]MBT4942755.1 tetratricopeptide repeat protein [Chloroflexota bacterium]MBT5893712.1 tetratricopeptide repeat protein [Chloroflexota bacterium]MBT6707752.1 tetratricopeptide repeat protein [Chloroflexota bacterium]
MPNPISTWLNKLLGRQQPPRRITPEKIINTFKNGVREVDEGHPKNAIKYFTEAIAASRNSAKLHHYRADAYALAGDHEQAIVDYDTAVRLNPKYPDTYVDRGNSHYQLEHNETALKDFSEAIRLKPDWGEAFANRAVIHAELGNAEESEADEKTAISMEVDAPQLAEMLEIARNNAQNL